MTHIWVPRVKIIEGVLDSPKGRLAGQYTIKKYKTGFKEPVQVVGPFENLITNQGLDSIGTTGSNYIAVGTGTAAPAVTDTTLGNIVKSTDTTVTIWNPVLLRGGPPDYWVQGAGTWRFNQGEATGTLTEVGFGYLIPPDGELTAEQRHRVFSRALIVDSNGSPNPITVLADEFLDVTYSLRFYPYVGADIVQSLNISGTTHTVTSRTLSILDYQYCAVDPRRRQEIGSLNAVYTGTAAGTPPSLSAITDSYLTNQGDGGGLVVAEIPYVPGSLEVSTTLSAPLNTANFAYGIRGMDIAVRAGSAHVPTTTRFQSTISPAIMKDDTKVLQFGVKFGWARK